MQKIISAALAFVRGMNPRQLQNLFAKEDQTNQPRKRRRRLLPLAVLATLSLNASVLADGQVPFKGAFNPVILSATQIDGTHLQLDIAVTVMATQLGKAQGPAFATLDLTDLSYVGGGTWAAANGDAVSFTFAGQFVPTVTPGVLENVETFELTGGTGRFEGATGGGVAGGLLDADTLVPLTPAPFVATISSPGSLKK
jgi:hypothetical protein